MHLFPLPCLTPEIASRGDDFEQNDEFTPLGRDGVNSDGNIRAVIPRLLALAI
jgi:hypothetical protein